MFTQFIDKVTANICRSLKSLVIQSDEILHYLLNHNIYHSETLRVCLNNYRNDGVARCRFWRSTVPFWKNVRFYVTDIPSHVLVQHKALPLCSKRAANKTPTKETLVALLTMDENNRKYCEGRQATTRSKSAHQIRQLCKKPSKLYQNMSDRVTVRSLLMLRTEPLSNCV